MGRQAFLGRLAAAAAVAALPQRARASAVPGEKCVQDAAANHAGIFPFDLPLYGGRGAKLNSGHFAGKPLWVNFFASWCSDCTVEMPDLVFLASKYRGSGLSVLGIDVQEGPDKVKPFRSEFKIDYPIVLDADGKVFGTYSTGHLPTHLFYNKHGVLTCAGMEGFSRDDMENEIRVALGR
jgi:thiol-disulfide isomerase/thioredoxin